MPHTILRRLLLSLAATLLVLSSLSQAEPHPALPVPASEVNALFSSAAGFPVDENSDPAAIRIEELRAQLASQNSELLAMQSDSETVQGEDAQALWSRSIELRIESAEALAEWANNVASLAAAGSETSKYEEQLKVLLPGAMLGAQNHFESIEKIMAEIASTLEEAGDDTATVQASLRRYDAVAARILAVATDQLQNLKDHGLATDSSEVWLAERLGKRARRSASRIHVTSLDLADAEAASAIAPVDTDLVAAVAAQSARLAIEVENLSAVVGLMDTLEIENAQYQRVLIKSTGELSTEMLDRNVVGELASRWLTDAKDAALENGPNVIFKTLIFILVVVLFWSISRLVRRGVEQALSHSTLGLSTLLKRMIVSLASGGILVIGVLIAFSQLGVEIAPLLAGLGIAGFVLGFALQETLANFASGIMILIYRPYDVEDLIECAGGVFGRVSRMNLVSTTVLTVDNQTRVVPNGKIWGDVITNVTAQYSRRVDLVFGISYSDDIPKTEAVLKEIVSEHPKVLKDPEAMIRLHELADSSVNFIVRPWVEADDYWDVYWDITREVKMRFDREGISIPFPQRDVHLPANTPPPVIQQDPKLSETSTAGQDAPDQED